jgi:hypothetical protein
VVEPADYPSLPRLVSFSSGRVEDLPRSCCVAKLLFHVGRLKVTEGLWSNFGAKFRVEGVGWVGLWGEFFAGTICKIGETL